MPAPAARPRFAPMLKPSGVSAARKTVTVCERARMRSADCASSRASSSPSWTAGATITCPELYGNLLRRTIAPCGRHTTSSEAGSLGSDKMRQNKHPGGCSEPMYSMRHGAHSRSIDLRLLPVAGDGGLGLDVRPRQGRDHTVPDPAFPPAPLHPRLPRDGGARASFAPAPRVSVGHHLPPTPPPRVPPPALRPPLNS